MPAIGQALALDSRLLSQLDELTEGLAPIIVDELLAALPEPAREGLSMIIVEQKPKNPARHRSRNCAQLRRD